MNLVETRHMLGPSLLPPVAYCGAQTGAYYLTSDWASVDCQNCHRTREAAETAAKIAAALDPALVTTLTTADVAEIMTRNVNKLFSGNVQRMSVLADLMTRKGGR